MRSHLFPLLLLLSILCIACQSSQGNSNSQTSTTTTTKPGESAEQIATNSLPPTQTYDLQVNTPTGVVMRLLQISYSDENIIATLAITNGSKEVIQLNGEDDMFLYDELKKDSYQSYGNTYRLSVPPDNPKIEIQPGTTIKGQFIFIGRLAPQAKFLGLITNNRNSYSSRSNNPRMELKDIIIKR